MKTLEHSIMDGADSSGESGFDILQPVLILTGSSEDEILAVRIREAIEQGVANRRRAERFLRQNYRY